MKPMLLATRRLPSRTALSLAVLLWSILAFTNTDSHAITADQGAIGSVTIGSLESELFSAFGEPQEAHSEYTDDPDVPATQYIFDGVEAYVEAGEVMNLVCHSSKYTTPDGVKVGDSIELVFDVYGETEVETRESSSLLRYNIDGTDVYLLFHITDRHVVMVELWYDYT